MSGSNAAVAVAAANKTVCVACKCPNGLYLQLYKMVDDYKPVMGGGMEKFLRSEPMGARVKINGPAHPYGVIPEHRPIGGYALTFNVDADFWDEWLKQYHDSALVKNEMIFAFEKPADTAAKAKENHTERSNMEPLRPGKLNGVAVDPRLKTLEKSGGIEAFNPKEDL